MPAQIGHEAASQDAASVHRLQSGGIAAPKNGWRRNAGSLWTDDAVALPPGERPVAGVDAAPKWLKKSEEGSWKFEITEYNIDFQEAHVHGVEAVESAALGWRSESKAAKQV